MYATLDLVQLLMSDALGSTNGVFWKFHR